MILNKIIVMAILVISISFSGIAQTNSDQKSTYLYTVKNVNSEEQLNEVFKQFEELKFVTKVKLNYKPEKPSMAQFIVYVTEPKRSSEGQIMFRPTDLKEIIISSGMEPHDFKIENY